MVLTPTGCAFAGGSIPAPSARAASAAQTRGRWGHAARRAPHCGHAVSARPDGAPRRLGRAHRPGDLWSDDPGQTDYNTMVRAPYPHSHEELRRADPLYDLVILTDWNWPDAVPGAAPPFSSINGGGRAIRPKAASPCHADICTRSRPDPPRHPVDRALNAYAHPFAENRRPDAHMRRPQGDCAFEIAAHAHRQAASPLRAAILASSAKCSDGSSSTGGMHISP